MFVFHALIFFVHSNPIINCLCAGTQWCDVCVVCVCACVRVWCWTRRRHTKFMLAWQSYLPWTGSYVCPVSFPLPVTPDFPAATLSHCPPLCFVGLLLKTVDLLSNADVPDTLLRQLLSPSSHLPATAVYIHAGLLPLPLNFSYPIQCVLRL